MEMYGSVKWITVNWLEEEKQSEIYFSCVILFLHAQVKNSAKLFYFITFLIIVIFDQNVVYIF